MSARKTSRANLRLSLHDGQWHDSTRISQAGVTQILIDIADGMDAQANGHQLDSWKAAGVCGRVLDIGCGTGWKVKTMAAWAGTTPYGCDIDQRVLAHGARRFGLNTLTRGACEALPFASETFDWAIASEVVEHLVDPEKLLRESARVLKPNGRLLLTTPNRLQYLRPWRPKLFWYALQRRVVVDESHVREFSETELRKLLAPLFEILSVQFVGTIVGWPRLVAAADLPLPLRRIWAQGIELVAEKAES